MSSEVADDRARLIEADPFCETVGIEVRSIDEGRATTTLDIESRHTNFHGMPHGGAIYTLADAAFAAAANGGGEDAFALETNISYLEAVDVGTTLSASAERTHDTRRTAEYEVVVTTEDGTRIATFRGRVYKP